MSATLRYYSGMDTQTHSPRAAAARVKQDLADTASLPVVEEAKPASAAKTAPKVVEVAAPDKTAEATASSEGAAADTPPVILVMHASVGSGHRSAAIAIAQMIEKMRDEKTPAFPDGSPIPEDTDVRILDALDFGRIRFDGDHYASTFTGATRPIYDLTWRYTFTGRLLWGGGSGISTVMYPKFTRYVREVKPLAVIATHIMGANIAVGARMITRESFPIVAVPTDYETEGLWPHTFSDAFCIGTEYMAETLRARKIPEEKIRITGIPTRTDFLQSYEKDEAREHFGLPANKKIVLALAGAHLAQPYRRFRESLDQTLPFLHRYADMHMVIIAGRDREYAAHLKQRVKELGLSNVTIMDYCTEMARLMAASDLAICKAGGLTVTECLCTSTPMILMGRAYGQEKANVNMLTGNGAAMHVTTARELLVALDRFSANPRLLDSMLYSANLLRKPNAARDIVLTTLELAAEAKEHPNPNWFRRAPHLFLMKLYWGHSPAHIR